MKRKHIKSKIFFGLIFIMILAVASIYTTPKAGIAQPKQQQVSFDFPTSYDNSNAGG